MSSKVHGMGQSFPFPSFFSHKCVRPCKMSSAWFCWLKVLTVKIKNLDLRPSPVNRYMTSGHKQNSHSLNNIFSRFLRSILFQLQRIQCIRDFSQIFFFLGGGERICNYFTNSIYSILLHVSLIVETHSIFLSLSVHFILLLISLFVFTINTYYLFLSSKQFASPPPTDLTFLFI